MSHSRKHKTRVSDEQKPKRSFEREITLSVAIEPLPELRERRGLDLWALRQEFLYWPEENFLDFGPITDPISVQPLSAKQFVAWQGLVRKALLSPPQGWAQFKEYSPFALGALVAPSIEMDWSGKVPRGRIPAADELFAILATITVDKLSGARFRMCASPDCKNSPFRVTRPQMKYCTYDCAHREAVRASRRRAKAESQTRIRRIAMGRSTSGTRNNRKEKSSHGRV